MTSYVTVTNAGVEIRAPFGHSAPKQITFGDDPPIPLFDWAYYLVSDNAETVIALGGETNKVFTVSRDGTVHILGDGYGQNAVSFFQGVPVWVLPKHGTVEGGTTYYDGIAEDDVPASVSPTSQGIAWCDSAIHFRDFYPQGPQHPDGRPTIHGILATRHVISGDWMVFLGEPSTVYAYRISRDALFAVWDGYTPVGPGIVEQIDGSAVVCINLIDGQQFFPSAAFVPVETPVTEPTCRPSFRRPMMFAPFFSYSTRYGVTDDYIGNVVMPSKSFYATATLPIIQFLNGEDDGGFDGSPAVIGNTLAYFLHGGGDIESVRVEYEAALHLPEKPVLLYLDGREWPIMRPAWVNQHRTFLAVQTYRDEQETPEQFLAAMRTLYERLDHEWACPLAQVPAFYARFGVAHALASVSAYDALLRDFYTVAVLPFADRRPTGMADHPALRTAARSLYQAIPGRPNRFDYWLADDETTWKKNSLQVMRYELCNPRAEVRAYWDGLVRDDLNLP